MLIGMFIKSNFPAKVVFNSSAMLFILYFKGIFLIIIVVLLSLPEIIFSTLISLDSIIVVSAKN